MVLYGQLIYALKSKFNHCGAFAANHYLWSQLTQNEKESIDDYAHRVKELFHKTFTKPLPESARHSLLSSRFISGLRYHQLCQRLNTNYSQNLLPTFMDVISFTHDFNRL
uniref:Retrotransposon gag domain-containing protein n=1 Tax=Plectus sambesii TaxID=2011161 RepID=A0A914X0U9_9BILA